MKLGIDTGINVDKWDYAKKEYEELREWVTDELDRVERQARANGEWVEGLDSNYQLFAPVIAELKRRIKEIREKYDL